MQSPSVRFICQSSGAATPIAPITERLDGQARDQQELFA